MNPSQDLHSEILGAVLKISNDPILTLDSDLRIVQINEGGEALFGCLELTVLGQPIELIIPKARVSVQTALEQVKEKGGRRVGVLRNLVGRTENGREFPIEGHVAHYEVNGKPFTTIVIRDVTDLKLAKKELIEREHRLRSIVDAAPFGAFVFESDVHDHLKLISANRAADAIWGRTFEDVLGLSFNEVFGTSLEAWIQDSLAEVAKSNLTWEREIVSEIGDVELVLDFHAVQLGPNRVVAFFQNMSSMSISQEEALEGWSRAMDARDKEVEGHSQRVTRIALALGKQLGLSKTQIRDLRRGAMVHDVGKIAIPDSILLKPGKLTPEERRTIEKHAIYGYDMLKSIRFMKDALDVPHYHHERWDGDGYPERLMADEIPILARVFAVADTWDAMRSDRPYRKGFPIDVVFQEIQSQAGRQFDPQVVEALRVIVASGQIPD